MARVHGYRVTLKGFMAVDKKSLDAQHEAIGALRAANSGEVPALKKLAASLQNITIETRQTSYDPDAAKAEGDQVKRTRGRRAAGQ
jgi:hypothetical protein